MIAASHSPSEIAAALASVYDPPPEELERMILVLAGELVAEGLLATAERAPATAPAPVPPHGAAFEPPELEKYDDLQEYLLADPIHEFDASGWPGGRQ